MLWNPLRSRVFWVPYYRIVMTSPIQNRRLHSYDEAIIALNSLQSNVSTIRQSLAERQKNAQTNLPRTVAFLEKSGMTMDDMRQIKFVHVSGTKGKGSTCAFLESILRKHGLKTGFFSSPHLVTATERIRLNGVPISQEKFTPYFWSVFDRLCGPNEVERPPYFMFMTLLAFHVFWKENVDVAIMEVGIGGSYDCTNVIPTPLVCGITALGIDHTSMLGNTIEEIAWHKAGIMKPGALTFVDSNQPPAALHVIKTEAHRVGAQAWVVPQLDDYDWGSFPAKKLGLFGTIQERNASIALQMSRAFLQAAKGWEVPATVRDGDLEVAQPYPLSVEDALGLRLCFWPGRSQTLIFDDVVFMLDGAHTKESMQACKAWFEHESPNQMNRLDPSNAGRDRVFKVLLFNSTGDHSFEEMLFILSTLDFDMVVFCTNSASKKMADNINHMSTMTDRLERCRLHKAIWDLMNPHVPSLIIPFLDNALVWITQCHGDLRRLCCHSGNGLEECNGSKYSEVHLKGVQKLLGDGSPCPEKLTQASQVQVLATGSLHLIGGVLEIANPDISMMSEQEKEQQQAVEDEYVSLGGNRSAVSS
ncbi:hypothetical protein TCAL_06969 [Tigriopus californicus]|uniref:Folylpolyglutamate synthase n=1 Tax=Tigriopus californicus TaxID=6832 RepID=A0A553PI19_TIGCA|nr:folylpolyglutamate synthase, mitochondrial-like [Tigriopus californicus]TRY77324.1 hypothetical protein TCAL_06969 [Tigriopus californicus]|eukprot:TCALIF_06969-PA protein Name:"Similar to FPGS Folylpolyglutamate synthase, mitochondrial (Bos taurus)" AED:0.02 eAED:0.02 QI:0/-1/0/1/-1/1/1/0/587